MQRVRHRRNALTSPERQNDCWRQTDGCRLGRYVLDGAWAHGTQSLGNGSVAGCVRPCARSLGKTCVCRRRTKASTCNSPSPRSKRIPPWSSDRSACASAPVSVNSNRRFMPQSCRGKHNATRWFHASAVGDSDAISREPICASTRTPPRAVTADRVSRCGEG